MSKLSVKRIRSIDRPGRTWDKVSGFHVWAICPKGSEELRLYWAQRLTVDGRLTTRTYGRVDPQAKDLADQIRRHRVQAEARIPQARNGHVPSVAKSEAKLFRNVMQKTLEDKFPDKTPQFRRQWLRTIEIHARPLLKRPLDEITSREIADTIRPIWHKRTGRDVRRGIRLVFDYAKFLELYNGDNPAGDVLEAGLSKTTVQTQNHRSLHYSEVGNSINKIIKSSSISAVTGCLILISLTAVRSQEARGARWDEIDWDQKLWTIPADRMKTRQEHIVPLSNAAIDVLKKARHNFTDRQQFRVFFHRGVLEEEYKVKHLQSTVEGGGLIFPSKKGNMLTAAGLIAACDRNQLRCSPHGFRASFRTWCQEMGKDFEASELCLSHRIGNATTQAYARGNMLQKRREIMEEWADYLNQTATDGG